MTQLIIYPDANPETSTIDGVVLRNPPGADENLTTIRSAAGTAADDTATTIEVSIGTDVSAGNYASLTRSIMLFDTSSIPESAIITSAVLSLYGDVKTNGLGDPILHIVASSPASNTSLAASDFNISSWGSTSFGNIAYADFNISAYNDITLNDSGILSITKAGITKLGGRLFWDLNDSTSGLTWKIGDNAIIRWQSSENTNKPKLTIEYTLPGGSTAYFM